jgi:hypothetical protein
MDNTWSDKLAEETRQVLSDPLYFIVGDLCMKNSHGSLGKISFENLLRRNLCIIDRSSGEEYTFISADDLIAAGLVVD